MPSTKVRRRINWDSFKLTTESMQEVVDFLNSIAAVSEVSSTADSILFKYIGQDKTLNLGNWVIVASTNVAYQPSMLIIEKNDEDFLERWQQV